jgi:predicted transporter
MEFKSLVLGLVFGLGVFAVKSGIGLGALIGAIDQPRRRRLAALGHLLAYLILFGLGALLLRQISLVDYFPRVQSLFRVGTTLHLLLAVALGGWGLALLFGHRTKTGWQRRGWLLLSLPCPVCATVIVLETALVMQFFPHRALLAVAAMATGFVSVQFLTALVLRRGLRQTGKEEGGGERTLGLLMVLLSAYFVLAACLMPQFAQIDRIYRLCGAGDGFRGEGNQLLVTLFAMAAVAGVGMVLRLRHMKRI